MVRHRGSQGERRAALPPEEISWARMGVNGGGGRRIQKSKYMGPKIVTEITMSGR
jgi:hypothetical protein